MVPSLSPEIEGRLHTTDEIQRYYITEIQEKKNKIHNIIAPCDAKKQNVIDVFDNSRCTSRRRLRTVFDNSRLRAED
jgi:hypothetical protein